MGYSITEILHEWMLKRRIISEVANEMGMNSSTLSAKLRPSATQAHLTADELVPLCHAARKAGYGRELDGVLLGFIREVQGAEKVQAPSATVVPQMLALIRNSTMLFECADRISKIDDLNELRKLRATVTTEMLPIMLQMEVLLDRRLKSLTRRKQPSAVMPALAEASHSNSEGGN